MQHLLSRFMQPVLQSQQPPMHQLLSHAAMLMRASGAVGSRRHFACSASNRKRFSINMEGRDFASQSVKGDSDLPFN